MEGPFKNLKVWQKAMELVRLVYQASKAFPADERYALTGQLYTYTFDLHLNC